MWIILLSGFLAGSIHILTGADHLAAIAPLAIKQHRQSWLLGAHWGMGHASGVGVAFVIVLLLRGIFNVGAFSSWGDRIVGVTLIGIGVWGIRAALKEKIHSHSHEHDGFNHEHIHFHAHPVDHEHSAEHVHKHAAFGVGILHGMSGTSHYVGMLPALALPSQSSAIAYVGAFGGGTVCAMAVFALVLGLIASKFALGQAAVYRRLLLGCCSLTIAVGVIWLVL